MTLKEILIQEIDSLPNALTAEVLGFSSHSKDEATSEKFSPRNDASIST